MGKLLTVIEVAERLKLHPESVKINLRSGCLRGFKAGIGEKAHWRVDEDDLNAWIEGNYTDQDKQRQGIK